MNLSSRTPPKASTSSFSSSSMEGSAVKKPGRLNSFRSTTAVDASAPGNWRQRRRRTQGSGVTRHDPATSQGEQEAAKANASAASRINVVKDDKAEEAKKEKEGGNEVESLTMWDLGTGRLACQRRRE